MFMPLKPNVVVGDFNFSNHLSGAKLQLRIWNHHQYKFTNWHSHVMILWVLFLLKHKQKHLALTVYSIYIYVYAFWNVLLYRVKPNGLAIISFYVFIYIHRWLLASKIGVIKSFSHQITQLTSTPYENSISIRRYSHCILSAQHSI